MNRNSLKKTLQRDVELTTLVIPSVTRVFDAPFSEYAYCNLKFARDTSIQAAYFSMEEQELKKFAEREAGSIMVEVLPSFFAFVWPEEKCRTLPVLQSYIDFCMQGANELTIDFWEGTKKPKKIIDDRKKPLYP